VNVFLALDDANGYACLDRRDDLRQPVRNAPRPIEIPNPTSIRVRAPLPELLSLATLDDIEQAASLVAVFVFLDHVQRLPRLGEKEIGHGPPPRLDDGARLASGTTLDDDRPIAVVKVNARRRVVVNRAGDAILAAMATNVDPATGEMIG
jgi:hypothetical protein